MTRGAALAAAVLLAGPAALTAQATVGASAHFMGYSFEDGLGTEAAQLFLVPVAVRVPAGSSLTFDLYSAWAEGRVEADGSEFTLSGPVDTRVKASLQATPWALLSVGLRLPTGNASHDGEEAVVAAVLATDLLGFREATWGTGFAVTSSVATAARLGQFGVGVGASYAVRGEFEPSSDIDAVYQPGNETRVRVGLDRNFGNSTFTAGGTWMSYDVDQYQDVNYFQAGDRFRADATYAFRAGAGVWTLYAADLWRENGDLTLNIVGNTGEAVRDTLLSTPSQNLFVAGLNGAVGLGGSTVFRPLVELRLQSRESDVGGTEGSGWIVAAGGDVPLGFVGTSQFFPRARFLFGSIEDASGEQRSVTGFSVTGTLRFSF